MKISNFFLITYKDISLNIKNISSILMIKSGFINQISSGIYIFFPIFYKLLNKLINLIKIELFKNNFSELCLPYIQPIKLWYNSNRYYDYKFDLFKLIDRKNNNYIISPTNEELITYILNNKFDNLKLPLNLFQINNKFRDEIRPSLGLIRTREFIMKDSYSFFDNIFDLKVNYEKLYNLYINILNKLNLNYKILLGKVDIMGGYYSHEFYYNKTRENNLCLNNEIFYKFFLFFKFLNIIYEKLNFFNLFLFVYTPNLNDFFLFSNYLKINISKFIKIIVLFSNYINNKLFICFFLLRGNFLEDFFLFKNNYIINNRLINNKELKIFFNVNINYLGFIKNLNIKLFIDFSILNLYNYFISINKENYILSIFNVNNYLYKKNRKFYLKIIKNNNYIELGHIFQIGDRYSKVFNFYFKKNFYKYILMLCCGMGITRILSCLIDQNYDFKGIVWPNIITPFKVVICPLNYNKIKIIKFMSNKLYYILKKYNIDVVLDDRDLNFNKLIEDWDLIGVPHKLIITENNLKKNKIEYNFRKFFEKKFFFVEEILDFCLLKFK